MPTTEAQKRATYNWRLRNKDQYKIKTNEYVKKYYANNSQKWNEKSVLRQRYNRECNYEIVAKIFLKILR